MDKGFKFNLIFDDEGKDLQKMIDELLLKIYIEKIAKKLYSRYNTIVL